MKTVMKKLFSLMLVAVLLVSAVPFQASASEYATLEIYVDGTLVKSLDGTPGSNVTIADCLSVAGLSADEVETTVGSSDVSTGSFTLGEAGTTAFVKFTKKAPAPQPCAVCGKAAHEGICCATCKEAGHNASAHCASCGSLAHAASAHCEYCNAVGSHTDACPTQQPAEEYVTFIYTPDGSSEKVLIQGGKVTTPAAKVFNGWRFEGWQYQGGLKNAGATIDVAGPTTIYASYKNTNPTETYELNVYVRRYVGGVLKETKYLIGWDTMQENDNVLDWLSAYKADIQNKVNTKFPGYTWNGKFYNFYHEQAATNNVTTTNGQKNIYINVKADQETVLVYVHLDGKKDHDSLIQLDGYSEGETVTSSAVASAVKKKYTYSKLYMYSQTGWKDHLDGKAYVTTKGVNVDEGTTKIHVNLHSPAAASGSGSSSGSKADSTNPKTGDMIMTPVLVLGASATCLAVLFYLNKKRSY